MSLVMDDYVELEDDNYCASLLILPTELLLMILTYLSTRDIISMHFVSQRIKEISETPSLWKKFVWPDYEPDHICVSKVLKIHGEHVKQLFLPVYVTPANPLEMIQYCPKVTHLSLPRYTQLNLDHLEEIVHTMTHLEQLDVFSSSIKCDLSHLYEKRIEKLLKITTASIKNLTIKFDWDEREYQFDYFKSVEIIVYTLYKSLKNNRPLPSIINLFICNQVVSIHGVFESCPASNYTITSVEIGLYDITRVPMDLYPSIPLLKFRFGPGAKHPLVKLSDYGILGLYKELFYLSEYDHYGKAMISVSHKYPKYPELVKYEHLHYISNINSVSIVNFFSVNIYPDDLEQLAIACPNLERLNLRNAENSLQNMQGLRAIVNTCQNLQGLNLEEMPVLSMESCLLLWELLSSIKKLTHLAIDLCMLIHINNNCYNAADKDKLIGMLRNCKSLKALEVSKPFKQKIDCECLNVNDLLLDHFPSLVYVRISLGLAQTECTKYAITNCHQLKYLYFDGDFYRGRVCTLDLDLLSSISCYLQQIFIRLCIDVSVLSAQVLSVHGGLEQIILGVKSITTSSITTLISNSPNLMLLYIVTEPYALCDENGASVNQKDYKDTVSKRFPRHKLLTTGDLILRENCDKWCTNHCITGIPFQHTTNFNTFW